MLHDFGMTIDHLLHVAILLLDFQPVGRTWKVLHNFFDNAFQQGLFLLQSLVAEIAHDETDRRFLQRASDTDGMQKTFVALSSFGRAVILGKSIDDSRGDLDRMLHLPFGKAGMGADPFDRDGGAICRKRLILDIAGGLAVYRIGKIGVQFLQVSFVDATTDLFVGREEDLDGAMLDLRIVDEEMRRIHDLGNAGLVVRA